MRGVRPLCLAAMCAAAGCGPLGGNHETRSVRVFQPTDDIRVVPKVVVIHGQDIRERCGFRVAAGESAAARGLVLSWVLQTNDYGHASVPGVSAADAVVWMAQDPKGASQAAPVDIRPYTPLFVIGDPPANRKPVCRLEPAARSDLAEDRALGRRLVDAVADYLRAASVPAVIRGD